MKGILIRSTVGLVVLVGLLFAFLGHQIANVATDWIASFAARNIFIPTMSDEDLISVRSVIFEPERNNIAQIEVSNLHVIGHNGDSATIGLTLVNHGSANAFPTLRIYLKSNGNVVRKLDVPSTEYTHPKAFVSAEIRIPISLEPGETGFTIKALYPDEATNP